MIFGHRKHISTANRSAVSVGKQSGEQLEAEVAPSSTTRVQHSLLLFFLPMSK